MVYHEVVAKSRGYKMSSSQRHRKNIQQPLKIDIRNKIYSNTYHALIPQSRVCQFVRLNEDFKERRVSHRNKQASSMRCRLEKRTWERENDIHHQTGRQASLQTSKHGPHVFCSYLVHNRDDAKIVSLFLTAFFSKRPTAPALRTGTESVLT